MGTLLEYLQPELLKRATDKVAEKVRHERDVKIAKTMFLKGIDLEMISAITKLSKKEIKQLLS